MSGAREDILARLHRPAASPAAADAARFAAAEPSPTPPGQRLARFTASATAAAATVARVDDRDQVASAIADYLQRQSLSRVIHRSACPAWLAGALATLLDVRDDPPTADGATLVTGCLAALAQEGVVVLASGAEHAAESAFLAATHIVIVEAQQLLDSLDGLWPRLREDSGPARMLNIIRGPSRTADLGVPARLGAHGPLRVHVILVASAEN